MRAGYLLLTVVVYFSGADMYFKNPNIIQSRVGHLFKPEITMHQADQRLLPFSSFRRECAPCHPNGASSELIG